MAEALFQVLRAGPLTTVQDGGRLGHVRHGVTEGGPMDRVAHAIGQRVLGNSEDGSALEVDVQGLALDCLSGEVTIAVTGGDFAVKVGQQAENGWIVATIRTGQRLDIWPQRWGNWCYVAFAGTIDAPHWLGSCSVNPAVAASGKPLAAGDTIRVIVGAEAGILFRRLPVPLFARPRPDIHVIPGPQERYFSPQAFARFYGEAFAVSTQYNRMGIRLDGPTLPIVAALDMPSEGILRGSVQVDGSGTSAVLMADHQTTGGYPKIATVITTDQNRLAQLRPRQLFRFMPTTVIRAIGLLRLRRRLIADYLATLR
jgi:biotin-dependent carboxylase-like uncharacterized protein